MKTRTLLVLITCLLFGVAQGEQGEGRRFPHRSKPAGGEGAPGQPLPPLPGIDKPPEISDWEVLDDALWGAAEDWPMWRDVARPFATYLLAILRRAKVAPARAFAARALEEIGPQGVGLADEKDPVVAGLLRALVEDGDGRVKGAALLALLRTARPTSRLLRAVGGVLRGPHDEAASIALACLTEREVDVMPALRVAFSGEKPCDRPGAIKLAGELGPKARPLAPALLGLLWHRNAEVRGAAANALLAIDHRTFGRAVDAAYVRDTDDTGAKGPLFLPAEPFTAHGALPRTVAMAGKMLKQGTEEEKRWALIFAGIVGPDALPLQPAAEAALEDASLRDNAIEALVAMGRPRMALAWVLGAARGEGRDVDRAWSTLQRLRPAPRDVVAFVRAELRAAKGRRRVRAAACLWALEPKAEGRVRSYDPRQEALSALIRSLSDPDPDVQEYAARAIVFIGPEAARAVPALMKWIDAQKTYQGIPDLRYFNTFLVAVAVIGPKARRAEGHLVNWLGALERLGARDTSYYRRVVWALHRVSPGHRLVVPALVEMERVKPGLAISVLGLVGTNARAAAPLLVRALRGRDHDCGKAASAALWKIDPALARKVGAW